MTFLWFALFSSCVLFCASAGVQVGYYKDPFCVVPANVNIDYFSMNWVMIDQCVPNLLHPDTPSSSMYKLEQFSTNGTWKLSHNLWDRSANCTGFGWIDGYVTFQDFDKCEKNFAQHLKVIRMDKPGKRPLDTVAVSKYAFESEHPKCAGEIVEVDYYYMNICLNIGDVLHPLHSKKKCDKSKKQYVVDLWPKQISECVRDPDDKEVHNIGECENGISYDCVN